MKMVVSSNMKRTLVVMAQPPASQEAKEKLCPPMESHDAARLLECLLLDTLEKAFAVPDTDVVIAYEPAESLGYFHEMAADADRFILQRGRNKFEKIQNCFELICEPGRSVVIIGTQHPTMPARALELAFDVLASGKVDIVYGPSTDGRLYLIGMTATHPKLFVELGPQDDRIIEKCVERTAAAGLGWYLLPESRSIDCFDDLVGLQRGLTEQREPTHSARHTIAHIISLTSIGVI